MALLFLLLRLGETGIKCRLLPGIRCLLAWCECSLRFNIPPVGFATR